MLVFIALLVIHVGLVGSFRAAPENITVTFINPTSVRISWQTAVDVQTSAAEKYDVTYKPVTYKPTDARVVAVIAGNSEAVILNNLRPDTQYQVIVAAIWNSKKYKSRPIVFRTLEYSPQQDSGVMSGNGPPEVGVEPPFVTLGIIKDEIANISFNATTARELPTIRAVEVTIIVIVLMVWAGAIALFFNRWGKIRMLLPYQPSYKQDQMKVPGGMVPCDGHSHQPVQIIEPDESSAIIEDRCKRTRMNSAIFASTEGRGFDAVEFSRRYGSQSVLCRKTRSVENITEAEVNRRFSEKDEESPEQPNSIPKNTLQV